MIRLLKCCVFLLIAGAVFAQVSLAPEPTTRFGGHIIGETFEQWMATNQMDLADICGPHSKKDRSMDFKVVCATLTELRSGKTGSFSTVDPKKRNIQWFFDHAMVSTAIMTVSLLFSSAQEQLSLLQEVYGPPTKQQMMRHSNLLGGTWETLEAYWNMPDGAVIVAVENLDLNTALGPTRSLMVSAVRAPQKQEREHQKKPNPYE